MIQCVHKSSIMEVVERQREQKSASTRLQRWEERHFRSLMADGFRTFHRMRGLNLAKCDRARKVGKIFAAAPTFETVLLALSFSRHAWNYTKQIENALFKLAQNRTTLVCIDSLLVVLIQSARTALFQHSVPRLMLMWPCGRPFVHCHL